MKLKDVGQVIATRALYELGTDRIFLVKIGLSQPFSDDPNRNFYCPIQIEGDCNNHVKAIAGVDAVQAIELAMMILGTLVQCLNQELEGRLRCSSDEDPILGFTLNDGTKI